MNLPAIETFLVSVKQLLLPHVLSVPERQALLMETFYTSHGWILGEIPFDGKANDFITNLCTTLLERDPTLTLFEILLIKLQPLHGVEGQAAISELLAELPVLAAALPVVAVVETAVRSAPPTIDQPILYFTYTAEDAAQAHRLAEELAQYGHNPHLERQAEKGSDRWLSATAADLSRAYAVLLIAGEQTWQDRWVQVELLAALDKRKQIIPLLLPDGRLPGFLSADLPTINFAGGEDAALEALMRHLPQPPPVASRSPWRPLSPDLLQRADELIYMDRLKMAELRHVGQYTRLAGKTQFQRTRGDKLVVPTIVARQELQHIRWRRSPEAPAETRRFEDAVPELLSIRRAVLLGEPGAGKTTTLYKLAADLVDAALLDRDSPIPLMIYLGLWTDPAEPFADFLRRSAGDLGKDLEERLGSGRAALLLDGLNEIPAGQQALKYRELDDFLNQEKYHELMVFVSCRVQDYLPERALALDQVSVAPLDPVRVHEFVHNYLDQDESWEVGEDLFWKLAGEDAKKTFKLFVHELGGKLHTVFATFWLENNLPDELDWGYQNWIWTQWVQMRSHPASLLMLAQNPYMLFMLLDVYRTYDRSLPDNRGELYDSFVETLFLREHLFDLDKGTNTVVRHPVGIELMNSLSELAFEMQQQRLKELKDDGALTTLPLVAAERFLDEQQRKQAANASLITLGDELRFAHQLLQEYFAARAMRERIFVGKDGQPMLKAANIWHPSCWWEPTNWEEATILLAGLYSDDCSEVVQWAAAANPEVAARCIVESGANTPDETKQAMRAMWLPRLVEIENDPDPRARAAAGRALGMVTLKDGQQLDNRHGVGFIVSNGRRIPEIAWGLPVPYGSYGVGSDSDAIRSFSKKKVTVCREFFLARYLITYGQFQCFVEAIDFADPRWWDGMPVEEEAYGKSYQLRELTEQRFKYGNHPRENVSWYQAVAFCRWLSDKLGYAVDLPHEYEWEVAARFPFSRMYPWGDEFDAARANIDEDFSLGRTSPVGIYPHGACKNLALLDLSGNVWEWCRNKYEEPDEEWVDKDPLDSSGDWRAVRGGSWSSFQDDARTAYRNRNRPAHRYSHGGFRVVMRRPPSQNVH